ncbi:DUF3907 family protein [Bacillus carboniphilus]|uniref:DUF3907 family protein n=1 Tax=Bacillus carboniphilus TaxID=86663 RepID=A0ABY9JYC9_9BACI|nr:DUF3907 family protein [Bacillus carboniphilus]WLR43784.1 DUF3907 family protein [Bacillus carboniphilus]
MGNVMVKTQLEQVEKFLKEVTENLNNFLDEHTIGQMKEEDVDHRYAKSIFRSLRRLTVYCEEGLEECQIILKNSSFRKAAAEKTLYVIYHQCIEEFYQPKNDIWFEDPRSAYTGKNAIKFRDKAPNLIVNLLTSLENEFQTIREELEYYETDYRTKITQSK